MSATDYPLVEVAWVDSASNSGWQKEAMKEPLKCWSAGYLVHQDKVSVVVALNRSTEAAVHPFGDAITIPAKCVVSVRRLK